MADTHPEFGNCPRCGSAVLGDRGDGCLNGWHDQLPSGPWMGMRSATVDLSWTTVSKASSDAVDELRAALAALGGHDLGCWCPLDQPCHADVLLCDVTIKGDIVP